MLVVLFLCLCLCRSLCRMSYASVDLFVLSFVVPCAYAYVASENQASVKISSSIPKANQA